MKKIFLLLSLLSLIIIEAQNQRFAYEYRLIADSTAKNEVKTEIMYLDVSKKGSKFYSREKYISDSVREDRIKKKINDFTGINFGYVPFVVEKSYPDYKTLFFNSLDIDKYKVTDDRPQNWTVLSDKEKIGECTAQKATLDFGGRNWTAWFVTDIPIQDGPYKFHGLPGLIVKIEDKTSSHSFVLKEVKKRSEDWITEGEKRSFSKVIPVNNETYKKQFLESRNNPTKGLRQMLASGTKIMMLDEGGKPIEPEIMLKMREKEGKNKMQKTTMC